MREIREMELAAMETELAHLMQRWQLSREEASLLFSRDSPHEQERTQRTLLELDRIMRNLFGEEGVRSWVHEPGPATLSPLDFLALGPAERSAMLAAARLRHRQVLGYDA